MGIFRAIRIFGILLTFGAFAMIGHRYHATMIAPAGSAPGPRFVSDTGLEVSRPGTGQPTMGDSFQLFWEGLTKKEPKPRNGLKDLHSRTALSRAPAPGSMEATSRETAFWINFAAKVGLTGP